MIASHRMLNYCFKNILFSFSTISFIIFIANSKSLGVKLMFDISKELSTKKTKRLSIYFLFRPINKVLVYYLFLYLTKASK